MYVLQGGVTLTIELKYDTGYFLVVAGLSNNIYPHQQQMCIQL